jgi:hypothetical protein
MTSNPAKSALTTKGHSRTNSNLRSSTTSVATTESNGAPALRRSSRTPVPSRSREASPIAPEKPATHKRSRVSALKDDATVDTSSPAPKKTKPTPAARAKKEKRSTGTKNLPATSSQPTAQAKPTAVPPQQEMPKSQTLLFGPCPNNGPIYRSSPVQIGSSPIPSSEASNDDFNAQTNAFISPPRTNMKPQVQEPVNKDEVQHEEGDIQTDEFEEDHFGEKDQQSAQRVPGEGSVENNGHDEAGGGEGNGEELLDPMVRGVEEELTRLSKTGGTSRSAKDVRVEMHNLNLHIEQGCFVGINISELEAGQTVSLETTMSKPC